MNNNTLPRSIGIIIVIFVGIIALLSQDKEAEYVAPSESTDISESSELSQYFQESEYARRKTLTSTGDDYEIVIEYPELRGLDDKKIQDSINNLFSRDVDEVKDSVLGYRKELMDTEAQGLTKSQHKDEYHISYLSPDLLSLWFVNIAYGGWEAHGHMSSKTKTYNLKTGNEIMLNDLFRSDRHGQLLELISAKLNTKGEGFPSFSHPDDLTIEDLKRFLITDQGIVFIFDPYEVASFAEGFVEILIPYEELKEILNPQNLVADLFVT